MHSNLTFFVTTLTLISNIAFVIGLIIFFAEKKFRHVVYRFVNKYAIELMLAASSFAVVGSLVYSNVIGFPPCELCWIQRIFLYPQAIILFFALKKNDVNIIKYLLPLSILGSLVALYHSLTQLGYFTSLVACTASGGECARVYVLEYGYITIPFMAFSTFVYLIAISLIYKKSHNAEK